MSFRKLASRSNISPATRKQIKIGAMVVLLAAFLHWTSSFQLTLAITIFVVFSLYLYLETLNQKILEQSATIRELSASTSEIEKLKVRIADFGNSMENRNVKRSQSNVETPPGIDELEADLRTVNRNVFTLADKVEDIKTMLLQNRRDIKVVDDVLALIDSRLQVIEKPAIESTESRFAQLAPHKDQEKAGQARLQQIRGEDELFNPLPSLPDLTEKMDELKKSLDPIDTRGMPSEILLLREGIYTLTDSIQQISQKLLRISEQMSALTQFNQNITVFEDKIQLVDLIAALLERTNERLDSQEGKTQAVSTSMQEMCDILNQRVDGLLRMVQTLNPQAKNIPPTSAQDNFNLLE